MEGVEWKWGVDSSTIYDVVDGGRFLGVKLSIKIVDGFHSVRADVLDERGKQRVVGRPCRVGSTPKSCALIIFNAVHPKNMWCMRRASEIEDAMIGRPHIQTDCFFCGISWSVFRVHVISSR